VTLPANQNLTLTLFVQLTYVQEAVKKTNMKKMGLSPDWVPYYTQTLRVTTPLRRMSVETEEVDLEEPIPDPDAETAVRRLPSTGIRTSRPTVPFVKVNYSIIVPPTAPVYAATNLNTIQAQVVNQSYTTFDSALIANLQTAAAQANVPYIPVTVQTVYIQYGLLERRPVTTTTTTNLAVVGPFGALSSGDSDTALITVSVILSLIFICLCFAGIFYIGMKNKGTADNQKEENNAVVEEAPPPVPEPEPVAQGDDWANFNILDVDEESEIQAVPKRIGTYEEEPEEPEEPEMPEGDAARVS